MKNKEKNEKDVTEFDDFVKDLQNVIDNKVHEDFSDIALEFVDNPYKYGKLPPNKISVQRNWRGSCGDSITYYLNIEDGIISEISYETDGCTTSSIAASQCAKMADKKSITEALELTDKQVLDALGKFPKDNYHCATLAVTTLHLAIKDYLKSN
ncbi:iron-sulfur cluster assembly scaffold protein [Promethearchaeum syntrophicum]|uniref:Iron-sulfur cluster assembly scaffold protein n=1 Tax=Promethearchaeum syntrophicum TaxID=2594042 RepID=A0A5B9D5Z1_9ARCH|nr:iron-sulfur cluster assembly scaffold protein [Candidatus Prometheoarchaeum syntrophicum]QEE14361.1 scaffold protein [Candidatus Prometheoarchaeum syntrophicum]